MTIINAPSALELSGNLTKFLVSSSTEFTFKLSLGATVLIERSYVPGESGLVEIDVRDIVEANLSFIFPQNNDDVYEQTDLVKTFTALVGSTTVEFRVIRCGVENFNDTAENFLTSNWLTWQPQIKKVSYSLPNFLTYYAVEESHIQVKCYWNNSTQQIIQLGTLQGGKAYTIPLPYYNFAVGDMISHFDVWINDYNGNPLTYVQRFVASNKLSEDEQWFLFENSLGGLDTIRAYGKNVFTGDHTHNLAEIDEVVDEYRVDTIRKYQKNTGHLDLLERKWMLDFFPSKRKYISDVTGIRQIVVIESDVTYDSKDLPSNYNFTYRYASDRPLLNIQRTELPAEMTLVVPDVGSFLLPPRLIDFPHLTLSEGALFIVQNPLGETVGVTTLSEIASAIAAILTGSEIFLSLQALANHINSNLHLTTEQRNVLSKMSIDVNGNVVFNSPVKANSFSEN